MKNEIEIKTEKEQCRVCFFGEIDSTVVPKYRMKIDRQIETLAGDVIFDFSNTNFVDSSGIGLILGRYNMLQQQNRKLILVNANPTAYKVFMLTGLFKIIEYREEVRC